MARPAYDVQQVEIIKKRVSEEALLLFREGGIENVSLRKIGHNIGASHTMLYRYFKNKDELCNAVKTASLYEFKEFFMDADNEDETPMNRLLLSIFELIRFFTNYSHDYRFLFVEDANSLEECEEITELRHEIFNHVVSLAKLAKKHKVIQMEGRTWTHLAWSTIHGALTLNYSHQLSEGRSLEQILVAAIHLLIPEVDRKQLLTIKREIRNASR